MTVWKRTLRTPSSERFLAQQNGLDIAAVDLHYLPGGSVAGTVIVLDTAQLPEAHIEKLLRTLDEDLLPDVDLAMGTLTYTVVVGRVLGNYEAAATNQPSP